MRPIHEGSPIQRFTTSAGPFTLAPGGGSCAPLELAGLAATVLAGTSSSIRPTMINTACRRECSMAGTQVRAPDSDEVGRGSPRVGTSDFGDGWSAARRALIGPALVGWSVADLTSGVGGRRPRHKIMSDTTG